MPGHFPNLSDEAVARLRMLVKSMAERHGNELPLRDLLALSRGHDLGCGITIDLEGTEALGSPMVVLRVPADAVATASLEGLTKRENEVARLVARGLSNNEIADQLHISLLTVKDHIHNILQKTGLKSRTQLALTLIGHAVE